MVESARMSGIVSYFTRDPIRAVGSLLLLGLALIAANNVLTGQYTLEDFVQQFIFGLSQGSIYALIALGYTLVYGILFMINFAHGEVFAGGAYAGFFFITYFYDYGGDNSLYQFLAENIFLLLLLTMLVAAFASAAVAVALERVAYRPLRTAPRLVPLITAIGASITLQELYLRLFGASNYRFPDIEIMVLPGLFEDATCAGNVCRDGIDIIGGSYNVDILGLGLRLNPISFLVFFFSLAIMWGLWTFIQRTRTGRAMRAVAEDKNTASLMGINVDRVIVITFVLGALLAGIGGVLFAIIPGGGFIKPRFGFLPGIKAFTAAVAGGIGNVPGAMFGGLLLGIIEAVGPSMLGLDNQLKDVVAFGVLVFVLIFRPTGIFGEVLSDKKV